MKFKNFLVLLWGFAAISINIYCRYLLLNNLVSNWLLYSLCVCVNDSLNSSSSFTCRFDIQFDSFLLTDKFQFYRYESKENICRVKFFVSFWKCDMLHFFFGNVICTIICTILRKTKPNCGLVHASLCVVSMKIKFV